MEQMLALVTGGARSIGRACCEALLKDGYRVVFFDVDDVSAAEFLRVFALSSLRDMPEFEQQDLEQMDLLLPSDAASEQELEQYKHTLAAASEAQEGGENSLTRPMAQAGLD